MVQILILFSCTCILLAQPLPTCAAYYTSLKRGAVRPPLISGDRRITLEIPHQPKRPSMKFLCVVHGVFVWVAKGAACACTWPAALLKPRCCLAGGKKKEVKFEEEEVEKSESRYRTNYRIKE